MGSANSDWAEFSICLIQWLSSSSQVKNEREIRVKSVFAELKLLGFLIMMIPGFYKGGLTNFEARTKTLCYENNLALA